MGKYFTNETLDGLWTRLVEATIERCEGNAGWVLENITHADFGPYIVDD
jgi:hypothetical protein